MNGAFNKPDHYIAILEIQKMKLVNWKANEMDKINKLQTDIIEEWKLLK